MKNNESKEYENESMNKNSIFGINTNYNTAEINKVMKSSKNIFTHLSPLLTETLSSFPKHSNNHHLKTIPTNSKIKLMLRNKNPMKLIKSKGQSDYIKTQSNFHTIDDEFILGPKNPPSIVDKNKLTSFYKMSGEQKISLKSPEEKLLRDKLFEKYDIKRDRYIHNYNQYNTYNPYNATTTSNFYHPNNKDSNTHLNIAIRYFKNSDKATKMIDINKQLVHRINEMSNYFLFQKYLQKIETNQMKKFYERKMPKIQIRAPTKKTKITKTTLDIEQHDNIEEKKITKKEKKKMNEIYVEKKMNSLKSIKFSHFRRFAYNGLIEPEFVEEIPVINIMEKKGEEENDKIKKLNKVERHYLSLIISKQLNAYKPNSRVDFSITRYENKIYLFGGFSSKIYNELWTYNIDTNKWIQIKIKDKEEPLPRKGHTSLLIKNTIFIYGGETPKETTAEDLVIYNIVLNKFYYPKIARKRKINQRKGHIMVGTNQTFLIQGGIDVRTLNVENSAFIYNIVDNYWERLEYIGKQLPYRAYHCSTIVNSYSKNTLSTYTFYSLPDDISDENKSKIRYEGIYLFGGINEKKIYCNDLYIIKIGKRPCINIKPKIAGKPPEPRIEAKMLFLENYFFIIIHGGIKMNQIFCDNIVVLNLENFNWIKPIIDDERGTESALVGRIKHNIFFDDEKLYIFGGIGEQNLLPLNFEIVEFEATGFFNDFMFPGED